MSGIGKFIAGSLLALCSTGLRGEDVDLFMGPPPGGAAVAANVLFIVDNTANWSRPGEDATAVGQATIQALSQVLRGAGERALNVGLLLYTEAGAENSPVSGGYIRSAIRAMDATTREIYARQIESLDVDNDRGAQGVSALALAEAYLYFSGAEAYAGVGNDKADYRGNVSAGVAAKADTAVWALPGNALPGQVDARYQAPRQGSSCGQNQIVFISHGPGSATAADTGRAFSLLQSLGGDLSPIAIMPGDTDSNLADEWSRFMADSSLGIRISTIDVAGGSDSRGVAWSALLRSIADVSGGDYYMAAANADSISEAVRRALGRVDAVDSSFATVALPVSANTRATFLNRVYVGQFRPDKLARPRWFGNLKQYKLGRAGLEGESGLRLLDARNSPVIDTRAGGTAGIYPCAQSYWTPGSLDTYWDYLDVSLRRGQCHAIPGSEGSNYPDGPVVEKGGQAYVGRGGRGYDSAQASSRVVKTAPVDPCGGDTGTVCGITDFSVGNSAISASMLGVTGEAERGRFINWAGGADTEDEDGDSDRSEFRPSVHGDVIHSRPVVIDYALDPDNPQLLVFYGSNDGMLRAINGNRDTAHNGAGDGPPVLPGGEFWAFLPPDYYPRIARALGNKVEFRSLSGQSRRPYGPDGPLTAWETDSGERYLALGMRRGGRSVYGLDVSDAAQPRLLWHLGCTTALGDNSGCAPGWENIGETWSALAPVYPPGAALPYLLMGGGYDSCEDYDESAIPANHRCDATSRGNRIYVLDASTGVILNSFPTERAVPGAITVVPVSDSDRSISYAYAADTGGNVYRISGPAGAAIATTAPSRWVLAKIADLGCGGKARENCTANRKFLFGPDVVRIPGTSRLGVLLGSGDREKPTLQYLAARSVDNYFFALVDDPGDPEWLETQRSHCGIPAICADSLTAINPGGSPSGRASISDKGWKIRLRQGEQVVSGALTVADKIHFSTHMAEGADGVSCSNGLGIATSYALDYRNGEGKLTDIPGGGLMPTPVAGRVELDDGTVMPFCIGCGADNTAIGAGGISLEDSWDQPKGHVYWKIVK